MIHHHCAHPALLQLLLVMRVGLPGVVRLHHQALQRLPQPLPLLLLHWGLAQ
jgi:hypothetical protein